MVKYEEYILKKLPPLRIGKYGQLQEWLDDYEENQPGHRHLSHLFGFFPGDQITIDKTPELAEAAEVSLECRLAHGGGQTGKVTGLCARDGFEVDILWNEGKSAKVNILSRKGGVCRLQLPEPAKIILSSGKKTIKKTKSTSRTISWNTAPGERYLLQVAGKN